MYGYGEVGRGLDEFRLGKRKRHMVIHVMVTYSYVCYVIVQIYNVAEVGGGRDEFRLNKGMNGHPYEYAHVIWL